ncbi:hypothetical protein QE152_g22259 [Popillia japonica]|uniref:Uncharacterized protein n=1 Tax=Popillia japonica TaxID=7064 RepID=A0AAW1KLI4_POPJA
MSDTETNLSCTPPQLREIADNAVINLLPKKSKAVYEKCYHQFELWAVQNNEIKKWFDPENPQDAEEMLAYLDSLESDDEGHNQFQEAESLEFVLVPSSDGQVSDQDDAPSDDEIAPSIGDLDKGLLAQKVELYTISKEREKRPVVCQSISLDKNTTNDESWDDSDIMSA